MNLSISFLLSMQKKDIEEYTAGIPSTSQIDRLLQNYVNHMFFRLILSLSMKSQKKFRGSSVIQMSMKAHTNNGLTTTIGVTRII